MATGGQGQPQQPTGALPEEPFRLLRIILGIIGTLLFLIFVVLIILSATKIVADTWGNIAAGISGGLSAIVGLFAWIWPFPADNASSSQTPTTPINSNTVSPTISPTFNVTVSTTSTPNSTIPMSQHTLAPAQSNANTSTAFAQIPQPSSTPNSIFQPNIPLSDPAQFYGRAFERTKLMTRINHRAATAIAGERRIGKTWLLRYIQLVASSHPSLGPAYRVGYLDGSHPRCKTMSGFVAEALQELKLPVPSVSSLSSTSPISTLAQAIKDLSIQNIVPVLCIDEFEGFDNRQEFGLNFVEGLRSMSQVDGLVLILAGRKRLVDIGKDLTGTTSPFFNIIEQLTLKLFTLKEAEAFAADKSAQANFSDAERTFLLDNATVYDANGSKTWPPLRLQLTGMMMLDDREQANDTNEPERYQIHEKAYQQDFKRRLNEQYQGVVKN